MRFAIEHRTGGDIQQTRATVPLAEVDDVGGGLHVVLVELRARSPRRGQRGRMDHHIRSPVQRERLAQINAMVVGQIAGAPPDAMDLHTGPPLETPQE